MAWRGEAPQAAPYATWLDVLAHASEYDYDPVWQRCVDLKVAVTTHSGSGHGRRFFGPSPENFIYNHIGHFAEAGEAFCKAVVLGGVARSASRPCASHSSKAESAGRARCTTI